MITEYKISDFFCIIDEFNKNFNAKLNKNLLLPSLDTTGRRYRNHKSRMSGSEITSIYCILFLWEQTAGITGICGKNEIVRNLLGRGLIPKLRLIIFILYG